MSVLYVSVHAGARRQWGRRVSESSRRIFKHGTETQNVSVYIPQPRTTGG